MQIVLPTFKAGLEWQDAVEDLAKQPHLTPFDPRVIHFLESFSKAILLKKEFREYPELVATAHWFRRGHVMKLKTQFDELATGKYLKPRGTVLHFAPANVDSIFVYTWILSLLMGNRNIIRLSRKNDPQMDLLLDVFNSLLENPEFQDISNLSLALRYDHEVIYTEYLSNSCDVRVIWGGDETVRTIRQVALPPKSVELVFPDRYSKSVLSASNVGSLSPEELATLAINFYNDSFWFGQMACSSPREVIWVGQGDEVKLAQERFWSSVNEVLLRKQYKNSIALTIKRMATVAYYAADSSTGDVSQDGEQSAVRIEVVDDGDAQPLREVHCGSGLFLERQVANLLDVVDGFMDKDQTLTYFGFDKDELSHLVDCISNRSIDRIVPVGQALEFSHVWDGYSFFLYLTREIVVN